METKPKILMCSEASFLHTGYGIYAKEILTRLHKTGKYELAEFASYGVINDPRDKDIPWAYYPNAVRDNDPRHAEYSQSVENAFGRWRFERVLLDFKPDIVFDIRDYWMNSYQKNSPLRKFFSWAVMPTVDSYPQQDEWIDTYMNADAVLSYSRWGGHVLLSQTNNHIKYEGCASPGVNNNIFKPQDQQNCRSSLGIHPDSFVVGSVMRNQKRKLLPDIIQSFRHVVQLESQKANPNHNIYLYLHTSYPDAGWNIPNLLKESQVGKRILFSYICKNCRKVHAYTFTHVVKICPFCKMKQAVMPSANEGVSDEQLSVIFNCFDVYVQYAICEGFGMPQVEAGACGIPIMSVDYSAMSDIVRDLEGVPIPVIRYFKELETEAYRAYPDNESLSKAIGNFMSLDHESKQNLKEHTAKLTTSKYSWDAAAKQWENVFDKILSNPNRNKWNREPQKYKKNIDIKSLPKVRNSYDLIKYISHNFTEEDGYEYSMQLLNLLRYSDYGFISDNGMSTKKFDLQDLLKIINKYIDNHNVISYVINNPSAINNEDYITYKQQRLDI